MYVWSLYVVFASVPLVFGLGYLTKPIPLSVHALLFLLWILWFLKPTFNLFIVRFIFGVYHRVSLFLSYMVLTEGGSVMFYGPPFVNLRQ